MSPVIFIAALSSLTLMPKTAFVAGLLGPVAGSALAALAVVVFLVGIFYFQTTSRIILAGIASLLITAQPACTIDVFTEGRSPEEIIEGYIKFAQRHTYTISEIAAMIDEAKPETVFFVEQGESNKALSDFIKRIGETTPYEVALLVKVSEHFGIKQRILIKGVAKGVQFSGLRLSGSFTKLKIHTHRFDSEVILPGLRDFRDEHDYVQVLFTSKALLVYRAKAEEASDNFRVLADGELVIEFIGTEDYWLNRKTARKAFERALAREGAQFIKFITPRGDVAIYQIDLTLEEIMNFYYRESKVSEGASDQLPK